MAAEDLKVVMSDRRNYEKGYSLYVGTTAHRYARYCPHMNQTVGRRVGTLQKMRAKGRSVYSVFRQIFVGDNAKEVQRKAMLQESCIQVSIMLTIRSMNIGYIFFPQPIQFIVFVRANYMKRLATNNEYGVN